MSKTKKRALTVADARKAMGAAQEAIEDTDGLCLVLLVGRHGDNGLEIFTPSIHPSQFDREVLKAIVAGISKALGSAPANNDGVHVSTCALPVPRKGTAN
jgi:hypothetical protein